MMTINLNRGEDLESGWKRIIGEQCQFALGYLKQPKNYCECVHETRKAFKKVRGLLRIAGKGFPAYKEENLFFRDQGRAISEIRDFQAVQDTLLRLYSSAENPAKKSTCRKIAKSLNKKRILLEKQILKNGMLLESMANDLRQKLGQIKSWSMKDATFFTFLKGLKKIYLKGRKMAKIAHDTNSSSDFHEWRKQAKYLRYQLEFLNVLWPNLMGFWESEMHALSDFIGEEHDLEVLKYLMEREGVWIKNVKDKEAFESSVKYHQEFCKTNALGLGARCYAECPKGFEKRILAIWEVYSKEAY